MLVPVRYSIRTNPNNIIGVEVQDNTQLERKILTEDIQYKPSELESMFAMDEKTQEI